MQHLGLLSIILFWMLVASILYRWGTDSNKSISDHVAEGMQHAIYTPGAYLYLGLMTWFLYGWLLPHLQAEWFDYSLLGVSVASLFAVFSVPRTQRLAKAHDRLTTLLGCAIFLLVGSLSYRHLDGAWANAAAVGIFTMLVSGTYLLSRGRRNYLQTEVFYFAMFHLLVLLLTYSS